MNGWWSAEADAIFRLFLAILLGGAIGIERESRGRPAGLRTHILVCLGATIIMLASMRLGEMAQSLAPAARIQVDPGRIAAGIVTGIGFLGAGAIIRIGDLVRGLTTAGCIWFVAALGITIGQGMYALATVATGLALLVLLALSQLERHIEPLIYRSFVVCATLPHAEAVERDARTLLTERDIRMQDMLHRLSVSEGRAEITFKISTRHRFQSGELLRAVSKLAGVVETRWS